MVNLKCICKVLNILFTISFNYEKFRKVEERENMRLKPKLCPFCEGDLQDKHHVCITENN